MVLVGMTMRTTALTMHTTALTMRTTALTMRTATLTMHQQKHAHTSSLMVNTDWSTTHVQHTPQWAVGRENHRCMLAASNRHTALQQP